jgi:putative nucleotidyltransferase with HDIG domain
MTVQSISFSEDAAALRVLAVVAPLAADHDCYLVGGAIRDQLMGRRIRDIDIAFDGDAPALARETANALSGHFALLDDERGTARVILHDGPVRTIDLTRLRVDATTDLAARDFTIDAMAAPIGGLARGQAVELLDPHGGTRDINTRTVRIVAEQALIDDPIRLLRAVRIATELDFDIEPSTFETLRRNVQRIRESAPERIRDEIARCFATSNAAGAVRLMDKLDLLDVVLPEVTNGRGVTQPKEHYFDVFEHNVEAVAAFDVLLGEEDFDRVRDRHSTLWSALSAAPRVREYLQEELSEGRSRAAILKLAALLHDVAKPDSRSVDADGRIRFFGHADIGAETARRIMRRLRFSRRETDFVATMIENHLRPGQLGQDWPPSRRAIFRFFRDTGDAAEGVLLLSLADALAARGPRMTRDGWQQSVAYIAYLLSRRHEDETVVRPQRLISGNDVMAALGMAPGREIGRLLASLEEAQAAGEVSTREEAVRFVREKANVASEGTRTEDARSMMRNPHHAIVRRSRRVGTASVAEGGR